MKIVDFCKISKSFKISIFDDDLRTKTIILSAKKKGFRILHKKQIMNFMQISNIPEQKFPGHLETSSINFDLIRKTARSKFSSVMDEIEPFRAR